MNYENKINILAEALRLSGLKVEASEAETLLDDHKFDKLETEIGEKDFYPVGTLWEDQSIVIKVPKDSYTQLQEGLIEEGDLRKSVLDGVLQAFLGSLAGQEWEPAPDELLEWANEE
ncbi:MAG: hypothetical protein CBE07_001455 [Pelagibacteraceae bacterium TMED247]|nr:MAG: hypothetical protein CBE07_001455 [Pelagibacteraceae bacterium TMED247]|tara:strand:- start:10034 stop:10384 length:351 start_codon:yes stop_codon:yes gene_type:complete